MAKNPRYQIVRPLNPMALSFERAEITSDMFGQQTEEHRRRAIFYRIEHQPLPAHVIDPIDEIAAVAALPGKLRFSTSSATVESWNRYIKSLPG